MFLFLLIGHLFSDAIYMIFSSANPGTETYKTNISHKAKKSFCGGQKDLKYQLMKAAQPITRDFGTSVPVPTPGRSPDL